MIEGMFALAHDIRMMRVGRGYFCPPEVQPGIPFTPGMAATAGPTLAAIRTQMYAETITRLGER